MTRPPNGTSWQETSMPPTLTRLAAATLTISAEAASPALADSGLDYNASPLKYQISELNYDN